MLEETAPPRPAAFSPADVPDPAARTNRVLMWCAWCAPVFIVMFFSGVIMAGIIPPPSPGRSPEEWRQFWSSHTDLKRAGLVLMMIAPGFTAPFSMALAVQMKRMEGRWSPMTYLQVAGGAIGVLVVIFPTMLFMAAAFRPDRNPEITQALTDIAFIPFVINWPPAALQAVALAVVVLGRPEPQLLPRWLGYASLWIAFLFVPGSVLVFFHHGAFAWNGLLSFWLVATLFGGWFLTVFIVLRRSFREHPLPA